MFIKKMFKNSQKGVSIFLAVLLISVLLAIGIGIAAILVAQMRMLKGMGDSVIAFYAADTGVERVLYEDPDFGDPPTEQILEGSLANGATYRVTKIPKPSCPPPLPQNYCIKSIGTFKDVRRAIEVTR